VREELAASYLPSWAAAIERQIGDDGPFFAGAKLHVVDLKLFVIHRSFASGTYDHIPASIFADYPRFARVHDAVRDHADVKTWYARA
jgi:hypothetical protein